MPHEEPVANPSSKQSADMDLDAHVTESPADSPSAPAHPPASAIADDGSSPANTPGAVIPASEPNGDAQIEGGNTANPDAASAPPALHPNAVADTSIHDLMEQMRGSVRRLTSFVDHVLNSTSLADEVSTEFCIEYERMETCVIQRDWELQFAALELQSLKHELEVERARSAALELRNKQLMAELDSAGDSSPALLPLSGKFERRASIPSVLAPVHVQVHELGLDGASEGVSVSSARALATSGHRRGSTALLMPHMKASLPEIIDPKAVNEQVQCAQRTEKGLSGYVFNKQTGLVNKYWKRRWCELVGSQLSLFTLLPSGELQPKQDLSVAGCSLGKHYKEYQLSFSIVMNDKDKTSFHFMVLDESD